MKLKEIDLYMSFAQEVALMSHAKRLKVGAVLATTSGNIISYGYNGTPADMDNCCELPAKNEHGVLVRSDHPDFLITKPEVIHAEMNAILKAAREGRSTLGTVLIQTHSPCINCAKLILQAGVTRVIYAEQYQDLSGVLFLSNFITVEKYNELS